MIINNNTKTHNQVHILLVVVGSAQWVQTDQSGEVDVVFDDHDVTRLEAIGQ